MNDTRTGHFQFCVDLGLPADQTALAQHREMSLLAEQLVGTFARHEIAATWATTQSVESPVVDAIRFADANHEIALLGDQSWLSESIRRDKIVSHFAENMKHAAEIGKPLTTLVLRDAAPESLYVVFKKRGINTLRPIVKKGATRDSQRDPALKINGMWLAPATAVFPARGSLLGRFDIGFRGKQVLNRARLKKTSEQLTIVASEMMESPTAALRSLDRILSYASRFRDQQSVVIETLEKATLRWHPRRIAPQRSVLRPAA